MTDERGSMPSEERGSPPHVAVSGGQVGIVGSGTVTMVTPRREIDWPVIVGLPPPMASAYQLRPAAIEASGGVALRQVLSGGGGVGKSQIAAGWFTRAQADVRVWVQGESLAAILTSYAGAALRLDLGDSDLDPETLAHRFLGFLAATSRSWLLVVDDVGDPAYMRGLWPAANGQLIVTTRRRDAAFSAGGLTVVDVGVYTEDEAQSYLEQRLTPLLERLPVGALEQAAGLAADLGYLPLALGQAAAVIIDDGLTCADYRAQFADGNTTLDDLFPDDADADGYVRTVATTWALAVAAADRLDPRGAASPLAQVVSVLDPAGAPEAVYTSHAAHGYLATVLRQGGSSASVARRALRALNRLSLITHDPDLGEARAVRMHNLTGRAIRQSLAEGHLAALVRTAAQGLIEIWPDVERDPTLAEALRANTSALRQLDPDALWEGDQRCSPLLFRAGRSLQQSGLVGPAVAYYHELHREALRRLGSEHPDTLTSSESLAIACRQAGDLTRAIALHEQTLADRERVLGLDHPDTLTSRNNLGYASRQAGDLTRAIALHEQTLADRERILGPDHPDTFSSRNHLAIAYRERGDLTRAVALHEQTLADRMRILGPDHPDTLTSRNNLGFTLRQAGQEARAIALHEQTLADRERILGPEHPNALTSRSNLAIAFADAGDLTRAIDLHEQTLVDRERILGSDHPDTLTSRSNLANAYRRSGQLARAIALHEQTLADRERVLGRDHPYAMTSRSNLAAAYEEEGDLNRAVALYEQTLADRERVLGPDHPDTLSSRTDLSRARKSPIDGDGPRVGD